MRIHVYPAISFLCLTIASSGFTADLMTARRECVKLQGLAVDKLEQRFEISAHGFSVLPPQGERWCYRLLKTSGVSFFKIPTFKNLIEGRPSRDEVVNARLFFAIAMSLKGFVNEASDFQSSDELIALVKGWLSEHLFSQIIDGVRTAEHRYRLLESNVVKDSYSGASCVRFDATVES
jgi:hypothetical protein